MTLDLRSLDDERLNAELAKHGSKAALAKSAGVSRSSVRRELERRGLVKALSHRTRPILTLESLHAALQPPNTCKVKAFLETLDEDSRAVVGEGLGYSTKDFPASALRSWLIGSGFREQDLPGSDAINDHRAGRRPCRCKG